MRSGEPKLLTIRDLLRPHSKALAAGMLAAIGGAVANLLEPFPLKLVLDNVLRSRPATGWLNQLILSTAGTEKLGHPLPDSNLVSELNSSAPQDPQR